MDVSGSRKFPVPPLKLNIIIEGGEGGRDELETGSRLIKTKGERFCPSVSQTDRETDRPKKLQNKN